VERDVLARLIPGTSQAAVLPGILPAP